MKKNTEDKRRDRTEMSKSSIFISLMYTYIIYLKGSVSPSYNIYVYITKDTQEMEENISEYNNLKLE